jgi:L-lysine exporter family protein LysE/ArgO
MVPVAGPTALATGLMFGLSLIVAVGPQNLFVPQQGVRREHVGLVVAICSSADVSLIAAGVAGVGLAIGQRHWLLDLAKLGGAGFVLFAAALAALRVLRDKTASRAHPPMSGSRAAVVAACLAFTLMNPGVYLDTVVLVGSVANANRGHQWWFGAGAAMASVVWFAGLGFGARLLGPIFERPRAWRWLDVFTAAVLTAAGCRLLLAA